MCFPLIILEVEIEGAFLWDLDFDLERLLEVGRR
jgi:hypothetical protein